MGRRILKQLRASLALVALFTVVLGAVYPLLVTAFGQVLFSEKAGGGLIVKGDKFVGSSLLGQEFTEAKYFWGRLSATTPPYNAAASGGSNLSPANPKLKEAADARIVQLRRADPGNKNLIPVDLVTASGSGLDPHISLAAALYQAPRVARARQMKAEDLEKFIKDHTERPYFKIIGAPRVNVLLLNLSLDEAASGIKDQKKK